MRIKWDIRGFEEIRRSPEVQGLVSDLSDTILAQLPRGYVASGRQGKSRYREIIFADTSQRSATSYAITACKRFCMGWVVHDYRT